MGVPKNKTSKANRRMNRAGRYADNAAPALSLCPQCHNFKQAHRACPVCGYYKGRPVNAAEDATAAAAAQKAAPAKAKKAEEVKPVEAAVETTPVVEEVVEEVVVEEAEVVEAEATEETAE